MERGQIVISKSGKPVELKEKKGALYIAYQLNENLERITERKINGEQGYLMAIISSFTVNAIMLVSSLILWP